MRIDRLSARTVPANPAAVLPYVFSYSSYGYPFHPSSLCPAVLVCPSGQETQDGHYHRRGEPDAGERRRAQAALGPVPPAEEHPGGHKHAARGERLLGGAAWPHAQGPGDGGAHAGWRRARRAGGGEPGEVCGRPALSSTAPYPSHPCLPPELTNPHLHTTRPPWPASSLAHHSPTLSPLGICHGRNHRL